MSLTEPTGAPLPEMPQVAVRAGVLAKVITRAVVKRRWAKMHDKAACPLQRHLHPLNRGVVPLCEECWGHNPERDGLWALVMKKSVPQ